MHLANASTIIVAFDGIIADTLPLRAMALAEAIAHEWAPLGIEAPTSDLRPLLAGRTFLECVTVAVHQLPALQHAQLRNDMTGQELVAMRAQREWANAASHGVPLRDGVIHDVHTLVARGVRLVVRSDSQRREVEPLLRLAGLEDSMLFLRCADDLPRVAGDSSLQASYAAIDARLDRLRIPSAQRIAVEVPGGAAAQLLLDAAGPRYVLQHDLLAKSL
jgi:beta-phosphoglucomutase-like phosphatase (HAD superfamily)